MRGPAGGPPGGEGELQNVLADVRRGLWVPPRRGSARDRDGGWEEREVPTLGHFAADLVASNEGQMISEATTRQRRWALAHVAPLLGDLPLDGIDVRCIDEFRDLKIKESEARARAIERGRPYRNDRGRVMKPRLAGLDQQDDQLPPVGPRELTVQESIATGASQTGVEAKADEPR